MVELFKLLYLTFAGAKLGRVEVMIEVFDV